MSKKFESPNYTQIPNEFYDTILREIDSLAELKVTETIMRATFGWHKDEDQLSLSQLQERAGLSRQGASDGVQAALKRGYVSRRKEGQAYLYSINVEGLGANDLGTSTSPRSGPKTSQQRRPPDQLPGVEASPRSRPTKEKTTSKEKGKETRPEVEELCQLMADLSNRRTDPEGNRPRPKYVVTDTWRDEMRRLIDIDGRSPVLIERAIRWVDQDSFWRKVILAAPKLREKFDQIYLDAQKRKGRGGSKADQQSNNIQRLREASRS